MSSQSFRTWWAANGDTSEEHKDIACRAWAGAETNTLTLEFRIRALEESLRGTMAPKDETQAFIEGIRQACRNKNPDGVTLLDFMTTWNEQMEKRYNDCYARAVRVLQESAGMGRPVPPTLMGVLEAIDGYTYKLG